MWAINLKVTTEQTKIHRHRQQYGGYQSEGAVVKSKGGQIYGDGRRFNFGWSGTQCTIQIVYHRIIHLIPV